MFDTDGPVAKEIADLWWVMLALGTASFVVFMIALVIGLTTRRRSEDGGDSEASPPPRALRRWVVGGGVIMPTVVLVVVMILTVATMRALPTTAPTGALRVEVVGHRWWYEIRYPDHDVVTANELHLPVDRPIELTLSSDDVIHSFWVPALGGKLDMLPDYTNTLVLEADETGEHRTGCAEFCGLQHARMRLLTVVETNEEFTGWITANSSVAVEPSNARLAEGQEIFVTAGCASCHSVAGTSASGAQGPDLTHLASRETLAAVTMPQTRQNLREWIADPHDFKEGVEMPPTLLGDAEMELLLDYLQSLR